MLPMIFVENNLFTLDFHPAPCESQTLTARLQLQLLWSTTSLAAVL
jgi:hypothetical protein